MPGRPRSGRSATGKMVDFQAGKSFEMTSVTGCPWPKRLRVAPQGESPDTRLGCGSGQPGRSLKHLEPVGRDRPGCIRRSSRLRRLFATSGISLTRVRCENAQACPRTGLAVRHSCKHVHALWSYPDRPHGHSLSAFLHSVAWRSRFPVDCFPAAPPIGVAITSCRPCAGYPRSISFLRSSHVHGLLIGTLEPPPGR